MAKDFTISKEKLPLGLRNNNPGNIRPLGRGNMWVGQTGTNRGFAVFKDIGYGIRAIAKNAFTHITKRGNNTVSKYISAYAPPAENDTKKYIKLAAAALGLKPTDKIPWDFDTLTKLVKLHLQLEIGEHAKLITDTDINDGFLKLNEG